MVTPNGRSRNTSLWIFPILLAVGLLFLIFGGIREMHRFKELAQKRESLIVYNQQLNEKNAEMYREISRLKNDPLYLEEIARREFGLVKMDEIIFFIEDGPSKEGNNHDKRIHPHTP